MTAAALAGAANEQLLLAHRDAIRFLNAPDSTLVQTTQERLAEFDKALGELADHAGDGKDAAKIDFAGQLATQYKTAFIRMVQATRGYMHLVYVVMAGEAAEIGHLARELKEYTLQDRARVEAQMAGDVNLSQNFSLLVSVFATLVGLILAWWITRNTTTPIKEMTSVLTGLARGRQDLTIPEQERGDEIGAMAMAAQVFKDKADELENASRYKSEFLANMSHELRTPLNSLLILAKILSANEDKNLSERQVDSAKIIHESGTDLLRLINDILDLSKVEAGRMDVVAGDMALAEFANSLERQFKHVAESRGLAFNVNVDPDLPNALRTDWVKVEQVIRNLLSNAFKFTAEGSVSVHFHFPNRNAMFINPALHPGNCLAMTVRDTGIGIPREKREQIFEAFRQVDGTTSRKYGGTGLGLSISRKFSELLGGELQVESEEGKGASFSIYLPLKFPDSIAAVVEAQAGGPAAKADAADFKDATRTVLVVDDDERNVFALTQILEGRVGQVLSASNGREALDLLAGGADVDIVLMDIMMPVMNGYDAMREIRKQGEFRNLPIIALTAKAMPGDKEKCLEAGASDYLPKPVETDDLVAALVDWLSKAKAVSAPMAASTDEGAFPRVKILADEGDAGEGVENLELGEPPITILIVDDDMRNTFSLASYLEKKADRVLLAQDGLKALAQLKKDRKINLVLMDIMMPNMDGYEAIRKIREDGKLKHLPVIALTAKAMPEDREKCLQAGADDYVSKPVELETLLSKMQILLQNDSLSNGRDGAAPSA